MIAALLLTVGLLLAPAGTFTYVYVGMTAPDVETMRIAKTLAVTGRWTAVTGSLMYLIHAFATGTTTSPPMLAVLIIAAVTAVTTHVTKLPAPQTPRPA